MEITMSLSVTQFKDCCGINIISGFGRTTTAASANYNTLEMTTSELKSIIKNYKKNVGLLLASLNEDQIPHYQDLLVSNGFNLSIPMFYHPGHGKRISLYSLVCDPRASYGIPPKKKVSSETVAKKKTEVTPASPVGGNPLDWRWTNEE